MPLHRSGNGSTSHIGELSVKDRDILQRVCLEEEERGEICEEYNVSRGYLRLLLHRARLRFRFLVREADHANGLIGAA